MLRHIKRDQQWVGDILYVDTSAVTVTDQQIHKPVRGAVSDTWYIITAGTRVGVFTSWCVVPHTSIKRIEFISRLGARLRLILKAFGMLPIVLVRRGQTRSLISRMP